MTCTCLMSFCPECGALRREALRKHRETMALAQANGWTLDQSAREGSWWTRKRRRGDPELSLSSIGFTFSKRIYVRLAEHAIAYDQRRI